MHGFQYKNKTYPWMTTNAIKAIINSQIWFDKADLINDSYSMRDVPMYEPDMVNVKFEIDTQVNWQPYNIPLPERSMK